MVLCCDYSTLLDDLWLSLYKTNPPCKVTVGRSSMHYVYLPQDQSSRYIVAKSIDWTLDTEDLYIAITSWGSYSNSFSIIQPSYTGYIGL